MPPQQGSAYQPYQGPPMPVGQLPKNMRPKSSLGLIIALVLTVVLLLSALGFGIWAFMSRQDYKDNSDQKSAKAVAVAVQQESTKKDTEFLEKEKSPVKSYQGPSSLGSLLVSYPKTWGAYVEESDRAATPLNGYFHPNFVPATSGNTTFALRIKVVNQAYADVLKQFDNKVKTGKISVSPFTAKNVPGVIGSRLTGEVNNGQKDVLVLLPLRDKTLEISTESQEFVNDFDTIILPSLKFTP